MNRIKKYRSTIWGAVILMIILAATNIPFRGKSYIFDWDQASDYQAVAKIAGGKLTLIGPRVTNDQGFFLAPWHYYFLLIFYKLSRGSLDMGYWGAVTVGYILAVVSFILVKRQFGWWPGLATGIYFAAAINLVAWGFMYVPVLSLIFFFACLFTLDYPKYLPWLIGWWALGGSTYAVFYALTIPLGYVVIKLLWQRKVELKRIVWGIGLAVLPYLPLIIFDLRHQFLNFSNIFRFLGNASGQGSQSGYFLTVLGRSLVNSWLNRPVAGGWWWLILAATVIIIIAGTLILFGDKKTFVRWWLLSALIPMAFYKGNISEYYYSQVTVLIPVLWSGLTARWKLGGKVLLGLILLIIIGLRIRDKVGGTLGIVLADKIEAVNFLESVGSSYSVSYEFKLGEDSGYGTVFDRLGKNYVRDGSAQLYTLTPAENISVSGERVFLTKKLAIYRR